MHVYRVNQSVMQDGDEGATAAPGPGRVDLLSPRRRFHIRHVEPGTILLPAVEQNPSAAEPGAGGLPDDLIAQPGASASPQVGQARPGPEPSANQGPNQPVSQGEPQATDSGTGPQAHPPRRPEPPADSVPVAAQDQAQASRPRLGRTFAPVPDGAPAG